MGAPKGNQNAKGNKGGGRKSAYTPALAILAEKVARLGATDAEIADVFGVGVTTLNRWKKAHVEFADALKKGKTISDARVVEALYHRAVGYSHDAVKIMQFQGTPVVVPYTEHYPPDTTACIFWLKNRQPQEWRDKQQIEHSGTVVVRRTFRGNRPIDE